MNSKQGLPVLPIAILVCLAPLGARAQQTTQNPVTSAVLQTVRGHARIMVAAAQEMPADKYGYAPTPQQMTFGHLVLHVAESNDFTCARIGGGVAPSTKGLTEKSPKAQLVAAVQKSFDFCEQALAKVNDSQLSEPVTFFGGRKMSKAAVMIALSNDLYDHYSQQAMYLRLNGHLPPTARPRPGARRGM